MQDPTQAVHWAEKASQKNAPSTSSFPSQIHQAQLTHQLSQEHFLECSNLQDDLVITRRELNRVQDEQHQIQLEHQQIKTYNQQLQLEQNKLKAENDQLKLDLKKASIPFIQPSIPIVQPVPPMIQLPAIAFGKAKWATYFGDIGQEPPLPPDIHQILTSNCPFWSNKKVEDTHMLVLIPSTVNGKPLTVTSLGELVKAPKQGSPSKYSGLYLGEYKDPAVPKSYWVLMTKDVLEGTRSKSYSDHRKIVAGFQQKTGIPYEVPHIIEATVCLFMIHANTGTRLYPDKPATYTSCQEAYDSNYPLVAGYFAAAGLNVDRSFGSSDVGVAGVRKFY